MTTYHPLTTKSSASNPHPFMNLKPPHSPHSRPTQIKQITFHPLIPQQNLTFISSPISCLLCHTHHHDTLHLFTCPKISTTWGTESLWTDPVRPGTQPGLECSGVKKRSIFLFSMIFRTEL